MHMRASDELMHPMHMRAGHETTGATLASLLPELQKQPRIMERLRQEQAELVQRMGPDITCAYLPPPS